MREFLFKLFFSAEWAKMNALKLENQTLCFKALRMYEATKEEGDRRADQHCNTIAKCLAVFDAAGLQSPLPGPTIH